MFCHKLFFTLTSSNDYKIIVIIFIILVPALTMRLIAEERKTGTIEVLATSPVTDAQVILGKFLAAVQRGREQLAARDGEGTGPGTAGFDTSG